MGGTSDECSYSIATAFGGSVYTTGYFQGIADFDPGAGTSNITSAGSRDLFLAKFLPPQPPMADIVVNDGVAQRSMVTSVVVDFGALVNIDAGAFQVQHLGS